MKQVKKLPAVANASATPPTDFELMKIHHQAMSLMERLGISYKEACNRIYNMNHQRVIAADLRAREWGDLEKMITDELYYLKGIRDAIRKEDGSNVKRLRKAECTETSYDTRDISSAFTGFVASRYTDGSRTAHLEAVLQGPFFQLVKRHEGKSWALVHKDGRVISVPAGHPDNWGWEGVQRLGHKAILWAATRLNFPKKELRHRRGNFPTLNVGISHGGDSTVNTGQLLYEDETAKELDVLFHHPSFQRDMLRASTDFCAMETLLKQIERSAAQQAKITAGWKAALVSQERYRRDITEVVSTLRKVQKSRDGLEVKCSRALSELDRLTEQRYADSQHIVAAAAAEEMEQEDGQPYPTRYPSSLWFYAFVLLALLTVLLVSRKF
ncbi:hypothetical protein HYPSUDRAFT_201481 [Hypholoma sublateritium FD-334 SS-4]|uniref:Uncharacterized protein n=1 Tax=Hypholoma sublateritium (strain FD-334 SS-4) TaxID=945553 RepID=A0A0D2MIJ0_HYPSF|nr:hypothetical protein HYPSUDRAFT_201481 [Hypholoma sublateritium FD-334 SS-4]